MPALHVFSDEEALAEAAAARIAEALSEAVQARGRGSLVLTGGSTPEPVYRRLASSHADALDWAAVHVFWGDERCVPLSHPDSNYRMAHEAMLKALPIPEHQIHPMACAEEPASAAKAYAATLAAYFGEGERLFDVTLLGLGEDGHTASLFPGSPLLDTPNGWVSPAEAPPSSPVRDRLTLTFPALAASRLVLFLVSGERKREALRRVLEPSNGDRLPPAARVRPVGTLEWFVDEAAHPIEG